VRYTSPGDRRFRWIAGAFYQHTLRKRVDDFGPLLFGAEPPGFVTERMPLYGGFVALLHLVVAGATPIAVALSQCAIDAGTCVVVALIGRQLAPALTLWAGLVAAALPTMVVIGPYLLTDTLFTAFAATALWAALRWHDRQDWRMAALLGTALAAAAMTRQVIVPWAVFVLVLLAAAALWRRRSTAVRFAHVSLAGLLVAAPLLGLAAHNHAKYGAFALSSQSGTHLLGWIVPLTMEARDGTPHAEGAAKMSRLLRARHPDFGQLGPFEQSRVPSELALERLAELGPVPIAEAWAIGAAINLMAPASTQAAPVAALPRTGFYDTPGETKLDKIRAFLFENENTAYAWLLLLGVAGVALFRIVQLWGLAAGCVSGPRHDGAWRSWRCGCSTFSPCPARSRRPNTVCPPNRPWPSSPRWACAICGAGSPGAVWTEAELSAGPPAAAARSRPRARQWAAGSTSATRPTRSRAGRCTTCSSTRSSRCSTTATSRACRVAGSR